MSNLNAALAYARRGWPIIPCDSDKTSLAHHSLNNTTTDTEAIKRYWNVWLNALASVGYGRVYRRYRDGYYIRRRP